MSYKVLTPEEAASLIKHGHHIGLSGFTPAGTAKAVTAALAKIAEAEHEKGNPFQVSVFTGASTGGAYAPAYIVCGVIFFVVCFPLSTLAARWEASLKERKGSVNANLKTANKKVELKEAA